ncbi:ABC transporter permease [Ureibacillus aquaedulcis]|uniref:ABC transporter permease n=1 Tax=Ureibacillus aquaedulcis TaxID=3058421 RepID=A0ABT8GX66_9BACL|nr:ABC transporter permease [Ureibacillus sp. BA0131]MDN4495536.1 ABC transporter permease [Ureibacillus sp. BA0131]
MLKVALKNDFLKVKKHIWVLIVGFPIMVILMQAANYIFRFEHLIGLSDDYWNLLLQNVQFYWPSVLILLITLVISSTIGIEFQHNMWMRQFSLPIKRTKLYMSKIYLNLMLIFITSALLFLLIIGLGLFLKFNIGDFSFFETIVMSYGTIFTLLPLFVILIGTSILLKNQAFTLTIGIASAVVVMYTYGLPEFLPFQWPHFDEGFSQGMPDILRGSVLGALEFIILYIILSLKKPA